MPLTATGGRNSSSVQFIRQRTLGHEPGRHKISNSRDQSMRVGICGPLIGQRTLTSACETTFPCVLAPLSHHGRNLMCPPRRRLSVQKR